VPKILPRLYGKPSRKKCLEKRANTLKNAPRIFYGTALDFCAGPYGLYRLFSPRKVCPAPSLIFVPIKCCTTALKSMPILSENTTAVHLDFCAHLLFYDLQKSVRMAYSSLLPAASKSVLLFALGCVLSFTKCCLSSQARPLSLSLALSTRNE
jgi:hypothetical protein